MSGDKKAYIVNNFENDLCRCVALTEEQYKAIEWLLDAFAGAEVSSLCIGELSDDVAEEIE